jgi:hypothetical protein
MEEWHKVFPHSRIADDQPLLERGCQLTLLSLPLVWDPAPASGPHDTTGGPA